MSDTLQALRRKIHGATELASVVRTMKAISAASIAQYERAVVSLADYYRTVELGLVACLRQEESTINQRPERPYARSIVRAVVFGSDQGLVGQFNETMADFVAEKLSPLPGEKHLLAVGGRLQARFEEAGTQLTGRFAVPASIGGITPLIGSILLACETEHDHCEAGQILLFHHQPAAGSNHAPTMQRLLPLDDQWRRSIAGIPWPTKNPPEIFGPVPKTMEMLVSEYVFVSLFKACAESLASENAARLAAMQRAEKNIDRLKDELGRHFQHMRQNMIDDELFDLVSGFEALTNQSEHHDSV